MSIRNLRIDSRDQLIALARRLRVRPDWHEPDEQELTAEFHGDSFDNAGFWGHYKDELNTFGEGRQEMWIELFRDGEPVAEINLATLLAWASEDREPEPGVIDVPGTGRVLDLPGVREAVAESGPAVEHRHRFLGQTLVHSHAGGQVRHGYFGHPEDYPRAAPGTLVANEWELVAETPACRNCGTQAGSLLPVKVRGKVTEYACEDRAACMVRMVTS